MKNHVRLLLFVALVLLGAGAWFVFPQERASVCQAVSSFCKSASEKAKGAWARLSPPKETEKAEAEAAAKAVADAPAIPTELGAIADPSSDPEPSSLTREQRKRRYAELVAAADKRKREIMFASLKKCPEGMEALRATRAYRAKVEEMKKLESRYGSSDTRVTGLRVELTRLKDVTRTANARYKAWKETHPGEIADPMADKLYCDLISRSNIYKD
jgi:hypothetical protein